MHIYIGIVKLKWAMFLFKLMPFLNIIVKICHSKVCFFYQRGRHWGRWSESAQSKHLTGQSSLTLRNPLISSNIQNMKRIKWMQFWCRFDFFSPVIVVSHTFGKGMKYVYGLYMNAKKNVFMVTNLTQELVYSNNFSSS